VVVALAAATAAVAASLLPWVRTGARERSSYELLAAARRLDVLDSGVDHALLVAWRFLPLLVALGWLALAIGKGRLAGAAGLLAGAAAIAVSVAVLRAPVLALRAVHGTMICGGVAALTAALSFLPSRSARDRPTTVL
jgi:hypothetical protein